jgi:hypothetical protein
MHYDINKKTKLALLTSAICAFISISTIAAEDSDDDSGCCGCFGSRKAESKRLLRDEERIRTTRGPFQVVVQQDGLNTAPSIISPLHPQSGMPSPVVTTASDSGQRTPLRRDSESGSELQASPSINLAASSSTQPLSSLQSQIFSAAQANKISERIWTLLSHNDSKHQAICDEINKHENADATFFEISFSNARMCKLRVKINGETVERRVEFTK